MPTTRWSVLVSHPVAMMGMEMPLVFGRNQRLFVNVSVANFSPESSQLQFYSSRRAATVLAKAIEINFATSRISFLLVFK